MNISLILHHPKPNQNPNIPLYNAATHMISTTSGRQIPQRLNRSSRLGIGSSTIGSSRIIQPHIHSDDLVQ